MQDSMFRDLGEKEIAEFRQWARANYNADVDPSPLWHPIVRDEWSKIKAASFSRKVCNNL